jgi:hypothetical protein
MTRSPEHKLTHRHYELLCAVVRSQRFLLIIELLLSCPRVPRLGAVFPPPTRRCCLRVRFVLLLLNFIYLVLRGSSIRFGFLDFYIKIIRNENDLKTLISLVERLSLWREVLLHEVMSRHFPRRTI